MLRLPSERKIIGVRQTTATILLGLLLTLFVGPARADEPATINYLAADKIYVNVGRYAGLVEGATVTVNRGEQLVAVLIADNVSSYSASCHVKKAYGELKVGDRIYFKRQSTEELRQLAEASKPAPKPRVQPRKGTGKAPKNRVRGSLGIQNYFTRDFGVAAVSSWQPAFNARLIVDDLFGVKGASFRMRHRSRLYHRSRALGTSVGTNEWTNRLSEFAVLYENPSHTMDMGFGRVISPYVNGMGYIDGAYMSFELDPNWRAGIVGGSEPNLVNSGINLDRHKFGGFLAYEAGSYESNRFTSTFALSSAYADGSISREFGYLQNTFSLARQLYLYQSVEIDYNRQWRWQVEQKRFSFSNLYLVANATPVSFATVNFSYDARRNIRDAYWLETPDSLFDDNIYTGYNGGLSLSLPRAISLRGNSGVRYDSDGVVTNRFYSFHASIRRFPVRTHSMAFTLSRSETPVVRAYRPVLYYRFPATRALRMGVSMGGYIYETQPELSNYYSEITAYQTLGQRYFVSTELRRYFGGGQDSFQMFAEFGLNL